MEEKNQRALDEKREAARYHEYIVENCQRLEEEEQKKIRFVCYSLYTHLSLTMYSPVTHYTSGSERK